MSNRTLSLIFRWSKSTYIMLHVLFAGKTDYTKVTNKTVFASFVRHT